MSEIYFDSSSFREGFLHLNFSRSRGGICGVHGSVSVSIRHVAVADGEHVEHVVS
jgi:hypothetical protein